MYILQVVIDGFKSYAQRTTVSGFDPQFNAITGLNGSGKSNILDSICFLLGISNLSQVSSANKRTLVAFISIEVFLFLYMLVDLLCCVLPTLISFTC